MVEKIVYMQQEDNMVTFERENGDTIIYPKDSVPGLYVQGDIIKAVISDNNSIQFLELDIEEMNLRSQILKYRKSKIRERARKV